MKQIFIIAMLFLTTITYAQQTPQAAVEEFFKAFHGRDTTALARTLCEKIVFHSVADRIEGAKLSIQDRDGFLNGIASIPKDISIEERILSWKIQVDGSFAHVWTPYEFFVDGKLSHSGVNSFQLFRDGEQWKIVHCIDTRRR